MVLPGMSLNSNLIVARGGEADPDLDINHIYNGTFESAAVGLEGWAIVDRTGNTMERSTVAPISGVASLHVTITDDIGSQGVFVPKWLTDPYTGEPAFGGQTWRLTFSYRADIPFLVYMDMTGASDVDPAWTAVADEDVHDGSIDFVIPALATQMDLFFITHWSGGDVGEYWLDNVKLIKIADAP